MRLLPLLAESLWWLEPHLPESADSAGLQAIPSHTLHMAAKYEANSRAGQTAKAGSGNSVSGERPFLCLAGSDHCKDGTSDGGLGGLGGGLLGMHTSPSKLHSRTRWCGSRAAFLLLLL